MRWTESLKRRRFCLIPLLNCSLVNMETFLFINRPRLTECMSKTSNKVLVEGNSGYWITQLNPCIQHIFSPYNMNTENCFITSKIISPSRTALPTLIGSISLCAQAEIHYLHGSGTELNLSSCKL